MAIFQKRQRGNRTENRNAQRGFRLDGGLMAQMAVRALRIVRGIVVIPVADHAGGKNQQRNKGQRNARECELSFAQSSPAFPN